MSSMIIREADTRVEKTYFRHKPGFRRRYGRTTTLVHKVTGETLGCWMGALTRKEAYAQYVKDLEKSS